MTTASKQATSLREALLDELDAPGGITKSRLRNLLINHPETGPRMIGTAEELDALPAGSVFRDDSGRLWEWEHVGYGGVEKALSAMGIGSMLALSAFRSFPATVLHVGGTR